MASTSTTDTMNATTTAPLARDLHRRRLIALYAFLGLLAVIIGIVVGVHRHTTAVADAAIVAPTAYAPATAVPTSQSVVATAPPGVPTPTPLATKVPSPTALPPTVPPTVTPPTPVPPAAPVVAAPARSVPVVNSNPNGRHDNGKGGGKEKDNGD